MTRKRRPSQHDRIEAKLDAAIADIRVIRKRVDHVEHKASAWGAVSAALVAVLSHLAGCLT